MINSSATTATSDRSSSQLSSQFEHNHSLSTPEKTPLHSLAALWARKYVISLTTRDEAEKLRRNNNLLKQRPKRGGQIQPKP